MPVHFLKPFHKFLYHFVVLLIFLIFGILLSASNQTSVAQQEQWVTYEDYDPLVLPGYSKNDWQFAVLDASAGGGQKAVGAPHASLTLTLQITEATGGFSLLYSKHPAGGPFQLYLDGGLYGDFDGYAETPMYTREISHITLPAGVYTLTLINGEGVFWFEAIHLLHGSLNSAPELGLLLQDDFDDGNFHLWREGHELEVSLVATGSGQAVQFSPGMTMHLWHGGHRNLALVVDVLMQSGQADLILRTSARGQYELSLTKSGTLSLYHNLSLLDSAEIGVIPDGTWHRLRFEAIEGNLTVSVDGVPVIETVDPDPLPAGTIALSAGSAPDNSFQVDNVAVWLPTDELPAPVQQTIPSPTPLEMTALQTAQTGELVYMCRASVPGIGFRWTSICTKPLEATDGVYFRESNSQLTRYGSPDWSPGGDLIGYSYHWIMTLDSPMWIEAYQRDNTLMSYFRNYETLINHSAVWSPDGSRMVYVALADEYPTPYGWTADSNALYTVPFPCRGCRLSTPLTPDGLSTSDVDPTWSPDGQWIAFGSNRSGDWGIWKISAAGGTPTLITRGEYPVWSPVANQIAFAKPNALGTRSIYVIDLDTDEIYPVTAASAAYNMIPSDWSPDGSQILFYQVNTTGNTLYTMHYTDGHQFNQPMTDVGIGLGGKWYGEVCLPGQTAARGMTALDDACQPEPVEVNVILYQYDSSGQLHLVQKDADGNYININPNEYIRFEIEVVNNGSVPVTVNRVTFGNFVRSSTPESVRWAHPMILSDQPIGSVFDPNAANNAPQPVRWEDQSVQLQPAGSYTFGTGRLLYAQAGYIETEAHVEYTSNTTPNTASSIQTVIVNLTRFQLREGEAHYHLWAYMFWAMWRETSEDRFVSIATNFTRNPNPPDQAASDRETDEIIAEELAMSILPPGCSRYYEHYERENDPSHELIDYVYCEDHRYMAAHTMINGIMFYERTEPPGLSEWEYAYRYFGNLHTEQTNDGTTQQYNYFSIANPFWFAERVVTNCTTNQYQTMRNLENAPDQKATWLFNYIDCYAQKAGEPDGSNMLRIKQRSFTSINRAVSDLMSKCITTSDPLTCDPTSASIHLKHANSEGDAVYASSTLYASPFSELQNRTNEVLTTYTDHIHNLENGVGAFGAYVPSAPSIVQPMVVLQVADDIGMVYSGIQWNSWVYQRATPEGMGDYPSPILPRYCQQQMPCK